MPCATRLLSAQSLQILYVDGRVLVHAQSRIFINMTAGTLAAIISLNTDYSATLPRCFYPVRGTCYSIETHFAFILILFARCLDRATDCETPGVLSFLMPVHSD